MACPLCQQEVDELAPQIIQSPDGPMCQVCGWLTDGAPVLGQRYLDGLAVGPPGPAGPAGPTGPTGPAGPSGPTGPSGGMYTDITQSPFTVSTAAADNAAAINSALATLGPQGKIAWLPPGTYAIKSPIVIGNGSGDTVSTWTARLAGSGAQNPWNLTASSQPSTTLLWTGAAGGGAMIQIKGPVAGWGLEGLTVDGNSLAKLNLLVTSGQWGRCREVTLTGAYSAIHETVGGTTDDLCNSMHNTWEQIAVSWVGSLAGVFPNGYSGGWWFDGSTFADTSFESVRAVSLLGPDSSAGFKHTGFYFGACDNIYVTDIHHYPGTGTDTRYRTVYDYANGASTEFPCDADQANIDANGPYLNIGTPSGLFQNKVINVACANGQPADPDLPGLSWETMTRRKGTAQVTAAAGTSIPIAHGLSQTPTHVTATPYGWAGYVWEYAAADATNIYLGASVALSAAFIMWSAEV